MIKHAPAKVRGTSVLTTALPSKNLEFSSEIEFIEKEKTEGKVERRMNFPYVF